MLTAYKHSTNNDIVETTLDHSASWINVVEPDREEIEQLIETYNLPEDFIRDPFSAFVEQLRLEFRLIQLFLSFLLFTIHYYFLCFTHCIFEKSLLKIATP